MKNIMKTQDVVMEILKEYPETRNSDDALYFRVCEHLNKGCMHLSFGTVILNRKCFDLPPFESVRRSRQKIQAAWPELAGNNEVEAHRTANETIVRNYARKATV